MNPYKVRQLNAQGEVVSEKQVEAGSYEDALRQLKNAADGAERIEVFNKDDESIGQVNVAYWNQRIRRR